MMTETLNPFLITEQSDFTEAPLFEKRTIVELTDSELEGIQGGTSPATVSSGYCIGASIAVTIFVGSAIVGYFS